MLLRSLPPLLLLPFLGSCSLFCGLFCGAPEEPLIPISHDSPEATVETLLAAVRNGDSKEIYRCLSEDLKEQQGFDALTFAIGWERFKKKVAYLHLAGDAEVTRTETTGPRDRIFHLKAYGSRFWIHLRAFPFWRVGRADPEDPDGLHVVGDLLSPAELETVLSLVDGSEGRLDIVLRDPQLFGLERASLGWIKLGWEWKVLRFQDPSQDSPDPGRPGEGGTPRGRTRP